MKYLIFILSFLIFLTLVAFYYYISKPEVELKQEEIKEKVFKKDNFFKIEKPTVYYLPARILFMKIDFKKIRYQIVYKVIIKNVDKYALFNIKTILESKNIAYSLFEAKKSEIYIFFKSLNEANSVLNLFKEYNFNIKIEKLTKRI